MSGVRADLHDTLLYLDGVTVSFDGFRALNALSLVLEAGEMRCLADYDFAESDCPRRANRLTEECVRFLCVFRRHQIVRRLEISRIDLFFLDEVDDVDRLGSFDGCGLEVVVRHDDEFALLVLVAFDDLVPRHRLAVCLTHALVFHG